VRTATATKARNNTTITNKHRPQEDGDARVVDEPQQEQRDRREEDRAIQTGIHAWRPHHTNGPLVPTERAGEPADAAGGGGCQRRTSRGGDAQCGDPR